MEASVSATAHPESLRVQNGLPPAERVRALITISIAVSMSVLDSSIANIALPVIARELHATPAASIWVVNAYQLSVTVSLLPLASLGEILGYRRVYAAGLALFSLASLGCALSTSLPMLVIMRVIQGFGGSGIMSVNTALVRFVFPRERLGRAVGFNAFVVATSSATGPTVAAAGSCPSRPGTGCLRLMCRLESSHSISRPGHCRQRPVRPMASTTQAPSLTPSRLDSS